MSSNDVVIVAAKRTPMGAFQGCLSHLTGTELGSIAVKGAAEAANLKADGVNEVFMGCVLPAGLGQAPARQAAIKADLAESTPCTTISKVCGSGMKATMLGCDQIRLGSADVVISGGMESMTNAPYLLDKARGGYRLGHGKVTDHMFLDGLEDAYQNRLMGSFAEETAEKYGFSREDQDEFASESGKRALNAMQAGLFRGELAQVPGTKKNPDPITEDETPSKVKFDKIPKLRPAFKDDGTVTAANSSSIADGAAALVLMSEAEAKRRKLTPLAKVKGYAMHAHQPQWFTTAPIQAVENVCKQVGWKTSDVDLFEINEAFAVVTMAAMQDLKIPHEKTNIWGGACALGHPIGASGARIIITLLSTLAHEGLKKGIASLCIGGGESTAIAVEMV